jgi:hypothetical protein
VQYFVREYSLTTMCEVGMERTKVRANKNAEITGERHRTA